MNDKYIKNEDVLLKEKSYLHFINSEFKEALHFKSHEIENELENRINTIISSLDERSLFYLNYNDLLFYERGIETMPAYYGNQWTSEYFLPFIQNQNPNTMLLLELISLVYSKSIYQMVISDIKTSNQLDKNHELFFDKETINFLMKSNNTSDNYNKVNSLIYYISILNELFVSKPTTRELTILGEEDIFYISSEMYRNITNKLLKDIQESHYKEIIQRIIGNYKLYFTQITYFTEIQPLFLKIIYDCLLNFEDILTFNNLYVKRSDKKWILF